jgi:hypothetical protein
MVGVIPTPQSEKGSTIVQSSVCILGWLAGSLSIVPLPTTPSCSRRERPRRSGRQMRWSILHECRARRRRLIWKPRWWGTIGTRWRKIASVIKLRGGLSRDHRARYESRRGSCIRGCKVWIEPVDRWWPPELSSRWRWGVLSRPVAWVNPRGARINAIRRHLSDRKPLSGRGRDSCRWGSSATFV